MHHVRVVGCVLRGCTIGRYYGHNDTNGRPTLEYPTFRLEIPANFATRLERSAHDEHRWMTSDQLPKLKWVAGQAFVFAAAKAWPDDALIDPANNDGHFEWVEGSSLSADQFNANLGRSGLFLTHPALDSSL